ncbi:MAG: hypothetical protein JO323_02450, partial [Acidobacteriia bacterium]|nr:hypothetical protein [Terriglobia bacterium]
MARSSCPAALWWLCTAGLLTAQSYSPPAGLRPPLHRAGASILPGGRIVTPAGEQVPAGEGPLALALSPSRKTLIVSNTATAGNSVTVLERGKVWEVRPLSGSGGRQTLGTPAGMMPGVAYSNEHTVLVAEGGSGQIAVTDLLTGERRRTIDLNQTGFQGSFAGDLAVDTERGVVYAADPANQRLAVFELRSRQMPVSLRLAAVPRLINLSPDRRRLYVALAGSQNDDAGSVGVIDVSDPSQPKLAASIQTGCCLSGIAATADAVYVTEAANDAVLAIDVQANRVATTIPIRIPGLESLRGVLPAGLAFHRKTQWLLVAEAGINAVGVIDTAAGKVLGHIPAGWFPTRIVTDADTVFVSNLLGRESGAGLGPQLGGTVSVFDLPTAGALASYTEAVLRNGGFVARPGPPPALPTGIRNVVLIVKGGASFDEVLGDVTRAAEEHVMSAPRLAHLGSQGYADGERKRLSLQRVNITPNQHAMAERWTILDNFYAESTLENNARQ